MQKCINAEENYFQADNVAENWFLTVGRRRCVKRGEWPKECGNLERRGKVEETYTFEHFPFLPEVVAGVPAIANRTCVPASTWFSIKGYVKNDGEVLAVCEATTQLLSADLAPAKVVIFIDSHTAYLALGSNTPTDCINIIQ
ncbi:hypothetical protein TNCV_3971701 [Trichonephila clavipes]|nr:hypothetical protein TNCV_3971701 [Trichonephila clavipes]